MFKKQKYSENTSLKYSKRPVFTGNDQPYSSNTTVVIILKSLKVFQLFPILRYEISRYKNEEWCWNDG